MTLTYVLHFEKVFEYLQVLFIYIPDALTASKIKKEI